MDDQADAMNYLHRAIVPYTTKSGLQIGRCYTPKPTVQQASCGEYYRRPTGYGLAWWCLFGAVSLLGIAVVIGGA